MASWSQTVKNTATPALRLFRKNMPSGNLKPIASLAGTARTVIVQRTTEGRGADGRFFKAYSPKPYYAPLEGRTPGYPAPTGGRTQDKAGNTMKSVYYSGGYAQYKGAIGRGTRPQLNVSGGMLGSIQIQVQNPGLAWLYFGSRLEAAKAHGHQFGTVVPLRPFFGLRDGGSAAAIRADAVKHLKQAAAQAKILLEGKP